MSHRILFYVDKDCIEKAFDITKGILLKNGIEHPWLHTSCGLNLSKKDGREWVSFQVNDDIKDKINESLRGFDWESEGVAGFEEDKLSVAVETDVEIRLDGAVK